MVNDLNGFLVGNLFFYNNDYQLSGNTLYFYFSVIENTEGGSHTVTINCPLVFTNFYARIESGASGGAVTENTLDIHLNGPIQVERGTLELLAMPYPDFGGGGGNGHIFVSGVVSGTGNVAAFASEVDGHVCFVEFNGTPGNTFSGALLLFTYAGGLINLNKSSGSAVTNLVVVTDRYDLLTSDTGTVNLNLVGENQIGGDAKIQIDSGLRLLLSGNNVGVGSLVLSNYHADAKASTLDTGSTLVGINNGITAFVDNDHVHPTIKGRLNLVGFGQFDIGGRPEPGLEIQAAIGGNGFQKIGDGTLRLNGNNTFSGDVVASRGTIEADTSTAFGQAGPTFGVHLEGGNILLQNVAIGAEPLFVRAQSLGNSFVTAVNQCSWAGPVVLETNLNVVAFDPAFSTNRLDISGSISGGGGLNLVQPPLGVGTVRLTGAAENNYTGTTLVRCPLVEFNKPPGTNAFAGPLVVGGGSGGPYEARWLNSYQSVGANATLYANGVINLNNNNEDFGPVTFNGGTVDSGPSGQFAIYAPLTVNPANVSAVINGVFGLPAGGPRDLIVGDGSTDCDLLIGAVVIGSPTYFVKEGAGTLCLANGNTFNAVTLLEAGTIDINGAFGLGTWPGLVIFDGATLRISGSINTGGGMEVVGAGVGGTHGAIEVLPNSSFGTSGNVLLDAATLFNVGPSSGLAFSGVVSGNGPLTKTGLGSLVLSGGAHNTYSGNTVISAGSLLLAKSANKISVPGNLIVGPGPAGPTTFARLYQSGGLGGTVMTINGNSLLDLNGNNVILTLLTLNDGGSVWTGNGTLSLADGSSVNVGSQNGLGSHAASTITGKIGLPIGSATFTVSPSAPTPPLLFGPGLDIPATISGGSSVQLTVLNKYGLGHMRLSGNNTYLNQTRVYEGALQVDGTQSSSSVLVFGGTLQGIGTVGAVSLTASAAALAPGDSPGILTCGNFGGGSGSLNVELNGTTAGSSYDQLNVLGSVNLSGMALNPTLGYASSVNDQFTIINNDGSDAVLGTFTGLPQGKKFYLGGELFQITYNGGSGNDVVLSRLITPPPPTLTIQSLAPTSVRLRWPINDPPFSLQTATNLTSGNWVAASPLPAVVGTNNVVTNAIVNASQFFRLSNP